jgi:uncharacterized repeat protein (TIGR02543 family)
MKYFFNQLQKNIPKKYFAGIIMTGLTISCIIMMSSCNKAKDVVDKTCQVTFILNQTNAAADSAVVKISAGELIQNAPIPTRAGFTFNGWYTNSADANPDPTKNTAPPKFPAYDIATKPIYLDAILYARWIK